jgi:ABC-type antimicrobial peptide transport system permease subunit
MKPDLIITIVLIIAKMTLFPTMPWIVIAIPFFISVGIGFVEGYKQAKKDRFNKNN